MNNGWYSSIGVTFLLYNLNRLEQLRNISKDAILYSI